MHPSVGRLLDFIGGGITRMAATGLATGAVLLVFGMTPAELVVYFWRNPPAWLVSDWSRCFVVIFGLALIVASLGFNQWCRQQIVICNVAAMIARAIPNLLNR